MVKSLVGTAVIIALIALAIGYGVAQQMSLPNHLLGWALGPWSGWFGAIMGVVSIYVAARIATHSVLRGIDRQRALQIETEARSNEEKAMRIVTALRAEILSIAAQIETIDVAERRRELAQAYRQNGNDDRGPLPFIEIPFSTTIYDSVAGDITLLPPEVADRIIFFYGRLKITGTLRAQLAAASDRFSTAQVVRMLEEDADHFDTLEGYANELADFLTTIVEGEVSG